MLKQLVHLLCFLLIGLNAWAQDQGAEAIRYLPVQDGGRIKPFDTFAKETLQLVYGKESFQKKPAHEIIMTWLLQPTAWEEQKLIEIRYGDLKKAMKLSEAERHFSVREIFSNERLSLLFQELNSRRETKEKLDPYYQAIQRLENQLFSFREVATGRMIRVLPPKEGTAWLSVAELPVEAQEKMMSITKAFVTSLDPQNVLAGKELKQAVEEFKNFAREQNSVLYPSDNKISLEVHYNDFHPFKWAWITYLLAALSCFVAWILSRPKAYLLAWGLAIVGFLLHNYGFALRIFLTERAPVSNMYETVIWVGWGTVVFAMIIEYVYKWRFILLAGTMVGFFCLALGDMAPAVLDPSIQPLEPVLRSNFWLLVHVLTITISYAAFFLAFALGDIGLIYFLKGEEKYQDKIKAIVLSIYRAKQIGVAFLAPGIILGGVWADYSWGRFWGWDPKETWALIALLGYIAVLHGRIAGMIKDFGMVASGILTFSLVIMAWYGVNFVLGAGLHSYGFGAGGVEYVSIFVGLHVLAVIFVYMVRQGRLKASK